MQIINQFHVTFVFWILIYSVESHVESSYKASDAYKVEHELQSVLLNQAADKCFQTIINKKINASDEVKSHCPPVFDGVVCWDQFYFPGTMAEKPCPNYVDKFLKDGKVYKFCTSNGTWYVKESGNYSKAWTDFSYCVDRNTKSTTSVSILYVSSNVGFAFSVASVIIAIIILRVFKNLHCDRNTIHINLFIACLIRSLSSIFIKFQNNNETNAMCKVTMAIHNYVVMANYTWVFVEALYLHNVLTIHTFQETSNIIYTYIAVGWGLPFIHIWIWITLRLTLDNTYCWESGNHPYRPDMWALIAYPTLLVIQNLIFFIKLISILHAKMSNHNLTATQNKFVKLGKSIIVLMVVFGLYHIIFIPIDVIDSFTPTPSALAVKFYLEYSLNSVQGCLLSMMFCFCNSEVLKEVRRKFHNHRHSRSIRMSDCEKPRANSCRRKQNNNNKRQSRQLTLTSFGEDNNLPNDNIDNNTTPCSNSGSIAIDKSQSLANRRKLIRQSPAEQSPEQSSSICLLTRTSLLDRSLSEQNQSCEEDDGTAGEEEDLDVAIGRENRNQQSKLLLKNHSTKLSFNLEQDSDSINMPNESRK